MSLVRSNFSDKELVNYEQQGRMAIINSIPSMGIIDIAREGAAHALIPMIKQMGFKEENIKITFRKEFTTDDLPFILDNKVLENGI